MPTLKNQRISDIPQKAKEIVQLLKNTEDTFRRDKAPDLYDQVLRFPRKSIGSEKFIELVYEALKAFNMDSRGARLSDFSVFKKSIEKHIDTIQSLAHLKLEKLKSIDDELKGTIDFLFDNLRLVKTKTSLVTFSKTMHFFLPNLFMPIDRKYTLRFFHSANLTRENQKRIFFQVLEQSRHFAREHRELLAKQVDSTSRWNRNIPKIIDNIIIAYVTENMLHD